MDSIRAFIAWLTVSVYNLWAKVPTWAKSGGSALVVALVTAGLAFNWTWPTDWTNFTAQIHAYWIVVLPVVWHIWQTSLWPNILPWLMRILSLGYVQDAVPLRLVSLSV
jgi:hypothetical protein